MIYTINTRYDELTLKVTITTTKPEKIRLIVKDADKKNTVFTDRWKTINGSTSLFVRMPVSGERAIVQIYNDKLGERAGDDSFKVDKIEKLMLEKKVDVVDFSNSLIKSFVNFATRFCFNCGHLPSGTYVSDDKRFQIEYVPVITGNNGQEIGTPARVSKSTGRIQVSMKKFIPMTVPMRMVILLHEFSHYYINDNMDNEIEADLNGLLIYLGLGYPRIEAAEAFLETFKNADSRLNQIRYKKIEAFINDFEKNNYIVYE